MARLVESEAEAKTETEAVTDALTWIKNVCKIQEKRQRGKQQKQRRTEQPRQILLTSIQPV